MTEDRQVVPAAPTGRVPDTADATGPRPVWRPDAGTAVPGGAELPPVEDPSIGAPGEIGSIGPAAPAGPSAHDQAGLAPVAPRSRAVTVLLTAAAALAIAGIAFGAGRMTAASTGAQGFGAGSVGGRGNFQGAPGGFPGGPGGIGNAAPPGPGAQDGNVSTSSVVGTVTAVTANGITVRTAGGASVEVGTTPATAYHAQTGAARTDVAVGSGIVLVVEGRGADRSATDVTITAR